MDTYRQCDLVRGDVRSTAFIPVRYAVPGRYVRIGDVNGIRVDAVYGRASAEDLDLVREARVQRRSTIDG